MEAIFASVDEIDKTGVLCSDCRIKMKRVFTAPGIVFKGSGWASKT